MMFNYHALDDVEFEILCKDIMQEMLNVQLRVFAKGQDGGVDLTDNVKTYNIVVQVKHYLNSTYQNLRNALKKELKKVEKLKPKQYFICCSKELTAQNIEEIYTMFSNYMASDKNIITLKEVDAFLQEDKNIQVVRRNFKLWLSSTNILSEVFNQNIFIDCETLLEDIKAESQYFVQTNTVNECLDILEKQRALILIGAPGVGKTITSKMLALYLAERGYRIRYTTNGDITDIKRAISLDKSLKEVILLDDCLGQCYFKLSDTQENELLSLIKYIKLYENKIIILNSRVTIFNEAKNHSPEFCSFIQNNRIKLRIIDIDNITSVEKARIFYNHLRVNQIPKEHYLAVRNNRNYMAIVSHPNYNPRIIEYVTSPIQYRSVKPENYYEYIILNLNNPKDVWKNEFDRRLNFIDRIFMNILYSLTENMVDSEILKECFFSRLKQEVSVDFTIDNFDSTLMRLNKSLVKLIDNKGRLMISVLNPSINDYLKSIFFDNHIELANIRKSILYFIQLQRCYRENEFKDILKRKVLDGSILSLNDNQTIIKALTIYLVCKFMVCNNRYVELIFNHLNFIKSNNLIGNYEFTKYEAVSKLFEEPICTFYKIPNKIYDPIFIHALLVDLDLEDLISVINDIFILILTNPDRKKQSKELYIDFLDISKDYINSAIKDYLDFYDLQDFYDELDLSDIIDGSMKELNIQYISNTFLQDDIIKTVVNTILNLAVDEIKSSLDKILYRLDSNYNEIIVIPKIGTGIDTSYIENKLYSFIEPDYDDGDDLRHDIGTTDISGNFNEIDLILDRDI